MVNRSKYKRVPDLYTDGVELELLDGNVVYVKALNPYEQQEARQDAQVARARIIMALQEHGSDDMDKVKATIFVDGRAGAVERILEHRNAESLMKASDALANDPDWKERLEIAGRSDEIMALPVTDPERKLLDKINEDYLKDITARMDEDRDYQRKQILAMSEDELYEEYIKLYIESYGRESAMAEHLLTEIWYSVRACDGVKGEDGTWSHAECEGHQLQVYETKAEVRDLPEALQDLYETTLQELNMTVREAKNSDRQGSSSESSPLPSEAAESTPSTPAETLVSVPGS